jgi:acyl-CoA reductase-like NAD-dependent aldehyde dehydrogenase
MHNSGFNCIAAQVLVLPEHWEQKDALVDEIRAVMGEIPERHSYYPESKTRCDAILEGTDTFEVFGEEHNRYLFPSVPATDTSNRVFSNEVFGPALAITTLPSPSIEAYLAAAVKFANESLYGSLGANVIIHPKTERSHAAALEEAVHDLNYGAIGINLWTGAVYFITQCAWGAFPGNTRQQIGSGVGVVHNTLMFDRSQKSIVHGPFAPHIRAITKGEYHLSPKLVYFVTNTQAHNIGEGLIEYARTRSKLQLAKLSLAALRG